MPWTWRSDAARSAGSCLWLAAAATGCANEQPPPGALPDARPPEVARFVPPKDGVVPDLDGSARIEFDEPVRLSGDIGRRIRASPAYRYRFEAGFSQIRIEPEEGWRRGAVYCFEVERGILDLLGNRTEAPIAYCFSTGPAIVDTRVEGRVVDRVSGSAVGGARVLFLGVPDDTIPYTAEVASGGDFSLRSVPPGAYWAYAFQDRNRDLRLDRRLEPHDSVRFELDAADASEALELALVEPDSTPPELLVARAEDSVTVLLEFDDPLRTEQPEARVLVEDSAGRARPVLRIHVGDPASLRREAPAGATEDTVGVGAAEDTLEVRTAEDTVEVGAAEDTVRAGAVEGALPGGEPGARPSPIGPPAAAALRTAAAGHEPERRPSRRVTVRLEEPLVPGSYTLRALDFVNLRRLVGGGDTTFVFSPETAGR